MVGPLSNIARTQRRALTAQTAGKDTALETMVPGSFPQTESDLASFSESTLNLLDRAGVRVAVLNSGQTLADSPGLPGPTESQYGAQKAQASALFESFIPSQLDQVKTLDDLRGVGERFTRKLRHNRLDFTVGLAVGPFQPSEIAERRGIPQQHLAAWTESFEELNKDFLSQDGDQLRANVGLVILPFTYSQGRPVAATRLRSARETTAEFVEGSLGLHRAEDRLVLLHQKFTPSPAVEVGNYRLAIHEMGHALDHVLDGLTGLPGFGPLHRQTVDALFAADQAKAEQSSVEQVFTTTRASEDVREYFAEAVEAYLTHPQAEGDIFRAGNSNPGLKAKNPELYSYMGEIFSTDFSGAEAPLPPVRTMPPEGYPDPETEVPRVA